MRFYFHLHDGVVTHDEEGIDLPADEAARARAEEEARVMASESVRDGHLDLAHYIEVSGTNGLSLFKVPFRDVVEITDSKDD